jgi:cbb3-type cytochrome oxidase subunit 3
MNPIELGKAIAEDGIAIITAVMLILVVGLVWYLIRRQAKREDRQDKERTKRQDKRDEEQKEERDYSRGLIKEELGRLHHDSIENAKLNRKSIALQKSFGNKTISALSDLCNKINGKSVIKP